MTTEYSAPRFVPSNFTPAWWLRNRHLQTIFPSLPWAYREHPLLRREPLELPDGDAIAIDWVDEPSPPPQTAPLLVILHGLESSSESSYARMLLRAASDAGWHACVMHFRDCGDYRNRLPRRYHAGETNDVRYFLAMLEQSGNYGPIVAVGYSLGGNVLLKYLGEAGSESPLQAATAVCVPLNLHRCSDALKQGFSRVYQRHLIKRMKLALHHKFDRHTAAFDWERAMSATTFDEFDDAVTAPLHGFKGKQDYYDRCSSTHFLTSIQKPTLIINANDDPFMTPDVIPEPDQISNAVTLEVADAGGHVGFISGGTPWKPRYYLPARILGFLGETGL